MLRAALGYTREDLEIVVGPMADAGKEPTGSMGGDAALAALSVRSPPLFAYFRQLFAQVTNPAIDPLREEIVMSLSSALGPEAELLRDARSPRRRVRLDGPVLRADELERVLAAIGDNGFRVLDATWDVAAGPDGLAPAVAALVAGACEDVRRGARILVLSDRGIGEGRAAVPSLLATSAVHHALIREGLRPSASLIVDSGEPREVHHLACLVGYGADAVHPWLLLDSAEDGDALVAALHKGLLKAMSKMGISTVSGYRGAQAFEVIGLSAELVDEHFTGTSARLGGIGLQGLGREALERHARAFPERGLPAGGVYRWRRGMERHAWDPDAVVGLQAAIRDGSEWDEYSATSDEAARGPARSAGCSASRTTGRRCRCARSSRRRRSCRGSPPARCRSARSPPRRTRTSRSP